MLPKMYSSLIFAILLSFSSAYGFDLTYGYYNKKCSEENIEKIVTDSVTAATAGYKGLCAGVIRLHFHDCFVRGCDGSVLLNSDKVNPSPEKSAIPNLSLRGFEVIDAAKAAVEKKCPGVVSCADILAFAARDCVKILGGFYYDVSGGRLDGKVSIDQEALQNLPAPFFDVPQLVASFGSKGLNKTDLVVLSGGHSIGLSQCSSFRDRLNDPDNVNRNEIDKSYKDSLIAKCTSDSVIVDQDEVTPDKLDSQWYTNNVNKKVLFFSDWVLLTDPEAATLVNLFGKDILGSLLWQHMFKCSMQKMGEITDPRSQGSGGEIRKVCSAVNGY